MCGDETRGVKTRLEITKKDALKMIIQSFLFNELLARKEFENANACKHKSFLTNKLKEEFLFQCTQNETTSYLHKNFLFHSNTQMLPKQTFFKRDFYIL